MAVWKRFLLLFSIHPKTVLFGVESWWNMIFWMGLVRIAEKSGLVNTFAKAIRPVLVYLFRMLSTILM